eukprot:TRINITY_DN91130_c0_g1_i1.p1 TRINITY_DN91130_c0_g1~~TRINITY_DN91130_c0_g1_i1.p1  ORF type:complete len:174 (+),score=27.19 TRINITY_DN91130_c0_g1_i1:69-524(+)
MAHARSSKSSPARACLSTYRAAGTRLQRPRWLITGVFLLAAMASMSAFVAGRPASLSGRPVSRTSDVEKIRNLPVNAAKTALAASWMPSMPQTCEDDFECNDGKANYPLQCIDFIFARICADPEDFMKKQEFSEAPAYVPIPVEIEKSPWE